MPDPVLTGDYVPLSKAAQVLNVCTQTIRRHAKQAGVSFYHIPGESRALIKRDDLATLARPRVRTARGGEHGR